MLKKNHDEIIQEIRFKNEKEVKELKSEITELKRVVEGKDAEINTLK
jgi:hypothetical protein